MGRQLSAGATRFVCGPQIDDDGYYEASGPVTTRVLAADVAGQLVTFSGEPAARVSGDQLVAHINACLQHRQGGTPPRCYGDMYDITVDGAGQITTMAEIYHP